MSEEMVPCTWCGKPTRSLGTKQCDVCWERNRHGTIPYDTLLAERNALLKLLSDSFWMIEWHEGTSNENDALIDRARALLATIGAKK